MFLYCLLITAAVAILPQQFSISSDYYNIYKEQSESARLDILYKNTEFSSLFHFNNTDFSIKLGRTNSNLSWKNNPSDLQSNLEQKQNYSCFSLYHKFYYFFIDSKVTLKNYDQKLLLDYTFRTGLMSFLKKNMELGFSLRKTSYPLSWNLMYQSAGFNIDTGQPYYLTSINSIVSSNNYTLGLFYEKNIPSKKNSLDTYSIDADPVYENVRLEMKHSSNHIPISIDVSRVALRMKSHLLMNDMQFSSINISHLSFFRINSDIRLNDLNTPLNFSVSYNFIQGNISGNAETWPFADIIQSIFVNRINFNLNGTLKIIEGSFSSHIRSNFLVIKPSVDLFYLDPEYTVKSWQPVFLVFGIKNYFERNDGINYMILGRAGAEADINIGIAIITLKIKQFFPLFTKEDKHQNVISGSTMSSPPSSPKKISGGTFISISLQKSF